MEYKLLSKIKSPDDVKKLNYDEISLLCQEIRDCIVSTVSKNGGHLASNLGAVELTVALHRSFSSPEDALIFDVGHQSYTHKLLTGRFDKFSTIRTENGLSGYMRPDESEHDPFITGHSSNSISAAYGIYRAKKLKGENGSYGLLRKIGDKYISNVIIVENSEFNEAGKIYTKHLDELCEKLKNHLQSHREEFLNFPFLSRQTDLRFILWTLISESVWHLKERVDEILETEFFKKVKQPQRKFTTVGVAIPYGASYSARFYGCDGNETHDFCGYSYVFIRNIYGKRIDRHYYCGQTITNDEKLRLTLKAIGGMDINTLDKTQRESAAKAIECGFLRKNGEFLEPRIVAIEQKDWENFRNLLHGYYDSTEDIAKEIATELHAYMVSHIQKHLLNEYKSYNLLVAGINLLNDLIEKCIAEDLLTEPQQRIGPEGVLLVVEK